MLRRFMLGCMTDPIASIVGVAVTGLEEVISRTTMIQRDTWLAKKIQPANTRVDDALAESWKRK